MKRIKILGVSLFASIIASFCGGLAIRAAQNLDATTPELEFSDVNAPAPRAALYTNSDVEPTPIDEDVVKISLTQSEVTSWSQSYRAEFSTEILTFADFGSPCFIKADLTNAEIRELPLLMYVAAEKDPTGKDKSKGLLVGELAITEWSENFLKTHTQKELDDALVEPLDEELPQTNGTLYKIDGLNKRKNKVTVPSKLRYTNRCLINIVEIGVNVVEGKSKKFLQELHIPNSIEVIPNNAIVLEDDEVAKKCHIFVEGDKKPGYDANFFSHPENVLFNQEYEYNGGKTPMVAGSPTSFGDPEAKFILGIKNDKYDLPLIVEYDYKDKDGNLHENNSAALPIDATQNPYDGVGSGIGGTLFIKNIDIDINEGDQVITESIRLRNIYKAVNVDDLWVPDTSVEYSAKPKIAIAHEARLDDFVEMKFVSSGKFAGYSTITLNSKFSIEPYKAFKPNVYYANEKKINSGEFYVRYRFIALTRTQYEITYLNGEGKQVMKRVNVFTPTDQFICDKEGQISFMFNNAEIGADFDPKNIVKLDILGLTISLDLSKQTGGKAATASEFASRFGRTNIINNTDTIAAYSVNADAMLIWTVIGYTLAYIAVSVGYFLYAKEKFKNDEFRRVKPKKFIKNALYGYLGSIITILTVMFISIRSTILNNTIVVFNPIDAFIICFTIVDAIIIGYAIKTLVNYIKAVKVQRRNAKLKIAEDEIDDGTK